MLFRSDQEIKPVKYYTDALAIRSNTHKRIVKLRNNEEAAIDEELKRGGLLNPEGYEETRKKFKESMEETVRKGRQEKKEIGEYMVSRIEPAKKYVGSGKRSVN